MWEWIAQIATRIEPTKEGFRLTSYGQISNHDASKDKVITAEGKTIDAAKILYVSNVSTWRGWGK